MNLISDYYKQYKNISRASSEALDALAIHVSYKKGYIIHREGQVSRDVHFIIKGAARTFYYRDGHDVTNQFYLEGDPIAAMESLYSGKPSFYNIELLEDCDLIKVNYASVEHLYEKHHDLESCGRMLAIHCYLEENERNRSFQMMTAKDRYLGLIKLQPPILNRVNLGHVASYIGVTQVQLSRIRAEIDK